MPSDMYGYAIPARYRFFTSERLSQDFTDQATE